MGNKLILPHLWKEDEPDSKADIKYHPQFGFEEGRKPKELKATEEEMDSANFYWRERDHCAHIRLHFEGCIRYNAPFWFKCKGLEHELSECYFEEHVHDMKEFEREKRLNARERRINSK